MEQTKAVAYCRVSTNKNAQLDSLEAQEGFFKEYAQRNAYNLVNIYADPGKSGVKIKNRTALIKLLSDAKQGLFSIVLIKDVSRLARNTVDFLTSIRNLKALGVKVVFVNYDQSSSESSEFMLTLLSAIAQEESANTSKRVKFGKAINAKQGRVPNLVYGYEKISGEYFTLKILENEAKVISDIFNMYANENIGANKIAETLNNKAIKTKRGNNWSQNAISRILTNKIYTGQVVNGKEEIEDFLTGRREKKDESNWNIIQNENLRIIPDEIFEKAQNILEIRRKKFESGFRETEKHIFSSLIKCSECGSSYKRLTRRYKNTYHRWVCGKRNVMGLSACSNATSIDEAVLITHITDFIKTYIPTEKEKNAILNQARESYKSTSPFHSTQEDIKKAIKKETKAKEKYIQMFQNDIITLSELKEKTLEIEETIKLLNQSTKNTTPVTETQTENTSIEAHFTSNEVLKHFIQTILVTPNGEATINLKQL